jgi:hypothetical protein
MQHTTELSTWTHKHHYQVHRKSRTLHHHQVQGLNSKQALSNIFIRLRMGKNKHSPGKRSSSTKKYYLSPFSPVHRQSLAVNSALAQTMARDLSAPSQCPVPHQPPRHELMQYKRNKPEKTGKSDWMVSFCHEPSGDIGTCCTAWLMPCVLHGKTHWRLKNISLGQDPHDWHASEGCNKMCWLHAMLGGCCCVGSKNVNEPT